MIKKIVFLAVIASAFSFCFKSDGFSEEYVWENRVYLASFPRSGNHWMRALIEEATGVATGSVYQDGGLYRHSKKIFPWGGYSAVNGYEGNRRYPEMSEIAVIKTHFPSFSKPTKFDDLPYKKTIRIVRHPIDSFYSFFLYSKKNSSPNLILKNALSSFISSWKKFQTFWDKQENVFTVRYEDLCKHPHIYLPQVMNEIGYDCTKEDCARALKKYPPKGGRGIKHISHFDKSDLELIRRELQDLAHKYGYSIPKK